MTRSNSVRATLLAILFLTGCGHRERARPNVLVITVDTLRADHLGSYGFALAGTRNIDQLAAEGVRCPNAISAAPITLPSHTSIFTGLLPPAHGVRDNGDYQLSDQAITLAERLRAAGYTTHAFVSAIVLSRRYNLNQGFETYDDDLWSEDDPKLFMIRSRPCAKTADRFLGWFSGWLKKPSKPFFTWIHFFDAHQPYRPTPAMITSPSQYDAEIATIDLQIGRIINALKLHGQLDNTIIVFTADHGESLGEHGEKTHAVFVYDATVRVPLIIRYPEAFKPLVYPGPVRSIDIMPTLLGLLRLPGGEKTQGTDLERPFGGQSDPPDLPQYSESLLSEVGFGMAPLFAVRDGGYKYIRAPKPELYDLKADPHELRNILDSHRTEAGRLDAILTKMLADSKLHELHGAANPMDRETEESLRALGYLAPRSDRNSMKGIDPKDGMVLYDELESARHLAQQQKWDEARTMLVALLAKAPGNVSALNILGLVELKNGDLASSKAHYQQSVTTEPNQFRVLGVLGSLSLNDGDLDGAEKYFRQALTVNPHFAEADANLGMIEALRGHESAAKDWYEKGIAADPDFPQVERRLGDLYFDRKDFAQALTFYQKALKVAPSDLRATLQAGSCSRRLGDMKSAEAYFVAAQKLRPELWIPAYNLACLEAVTGRPEAALATLLVAAKQDPLEKELLEQDPDLKTVRALPGYKALLAYTD